MCCNSARESDLDCMFVEITMLDEDTDSDTLPPVNAITDESARLVVPFGSRILLPALFK